VVGGASRSGQKVDHEVQQWAECSVTRSQQARSGLLDLVTVVEARDANPLGNFRSIVQIREPEHCGRAIAQNGHAALIGDPSQAAVGCCHLWRHL
jgi:hypothetical protein